MKESYLNVAAYLFFPLKDPHALREQVRPFCRELGLKGSILLSEEGINSFLCGSPDQIQTYQKYLHGELQIPQMEYKESWSERVPFRRMLVKVKKEIIHMGFDEIKPKEYTGPRLKPQELKKWLDEKRDVTLLDTRNDYETRLGHFKGARTLPVNSFRDFVREAKKLPQEVKSKPVVMYCTGGIRCEKASALFLKNYGFKEVYQLDGGILKYFEEVGGSHYEGECFVFDYRVGLAPDLKETATKQCYACRSPLTEQDLNRSEYELGKKCHYCVADPSIKLRNPTRT